MRSLLRSSTDHRYWEALEKSSQVVYLYGSKSWIKTCNNTTSIKLELKLHQHHAY